MRQALAIRLPVSVEGTPLAHILMNLLPILFLDQDPIEQELALRRILP